MDTTVRLGPLKFSLRATIDHHGPSIHSGHYTASINCCKITFYCNDNTITQFGITDNKNSSTAYVILYELIDTWFLDSSRGVEFWSPHGAGTSYPSHWQQVEEQAPKPVGWMMCFLLMTLVPVQKLCVNIYIYICIPYMSSVMWRIYICIYIQRECHSVLAKLHPITFYRIVFLGSGRFLGWMPLFGFFGLSIVSCSLIKA